MIWREFPLQISGLFSEQWLLMADFSGGKKTVFWERFLGGETSGCMIQFDDHIAQMGWFNHQQGWFIYQYLQGFSAPSL